MGTGMTDIEKVLAIEELKCLRARYFRYVDTKDWDSFVKLFTNDVYFDISTEENVCILQNPQAVVEMASAGLRDCISVHHGQCHEINITSDTTADGMIAMQDMLRWEDSAASQLRTLHGYGHYIDTYRKIDGTWCIQAMQLKRLRVDTTPKMMQNKQDPSNTYWRRAFPQCAGRLSRDC